MRSVIQAFAGTEARLLVTDRAGERGSVEVTHEALIRHWRELRAWIDANRDNLRTRARLKEDRTEWLKRNKDPELLGIPSLRLKEVQKLSEEPGDVRIDDIEDYIEALLDHDRQRKKAEEANQQRELEAPRRRTWIAAAAAALLLLVAVLAGREAWVANEQKAVADSQTAAANEQKTLAEQQKAFANKQTMAALNNETHALAALSRAAARENRALDGVELALAAWPRGVGALERPMLGDAVRYLSLSFSEHPPVAVLHHGGPVNGAVYSLDGQRILSWSNDNTLRLWDAATGAAIGEPLRHQDVVNGAVYSPDGKRILSWSEDNTLRLWDAATGGGDRRAATASGCGQWRGLFAEQPAHPAVV
jgi:WD domain, G-beta repeat